MPPLFGSRKPLRDGIARFDLLQIGGLGAFGLSPADVAKLSALQALRCTGPASPICVQSRVNHIR
jgi:hypothetical protein